MLAIVLNEFANPRNVLTVVDRLCRKSKYYVSHDNFRSFKRTTEEVDEGLSTHVFHQYFIAAFYQNFPIDIVSSVAQIKENFARRCDKSDFAIFAQAKHYMVQALTLAGRAKVVNVENTNWGNN